jgi:hypothetical protein
MLKQTGLEMKKINFLNFSAKYFRCAWQLTNCYASLDAGNSRDLSHKAISPQRKGLEKGLEKGLRRC